MYDFDARNEILHETHFSLLPLSLYLSRNVRRNRNSISSAIYERAHGATLAVFDVACSDDLLPDNIRPSTHENSRYGESR